MAITLTRGATSVVFSKGISFPISRPIHFMQPEGETDGGVRYVYDKGHYLAFPLTFTRLSKTDYDAYRSFMLNTVNGKALSFTLTDENGDPHTVRLDQETWDLPQDVYRLYSGTVQFREEL